MADGLRYRCLVFDHDDTVMDSTREIHYPAFLKAMEALRPGLSMTLEDYYRINFHPGLSAYYRDVLCLTEQEQDLEYKIWQDYVQAHIPEAYPAMRRVIERQKAEGGFVCVASYSVGCNILRDYRENGLPEPDLVYGWELPEEQRKPSPFPLHDIMRRLGLSPAELLVVDDQGSGAEMACRCGVAFAAAGWAYEIPEIRDSMRGRGDYYFASEEALERFLFGESRA